MHAEYCLFEGICMLGRRFTGSTVRHRLPWWMPLLLLVQAALVGAPAAAGCPCCCRLPCWMPLQLLNESATSTPFLPLVGAGVHAAAAAAVTAAEAA